MFGVHQCRQPGKPVITSKQPTMQSSIVEQEMDLDLPTPSRLTLAFLLNLI